MDIVSSGNHTFEFLRHPYRRHVALQWDDFIALAALSLLALTSIRAYVSRDKQLDDLKSFFVSPQLEDGLAPEQEQPNQPPETRNIAEKLKQSGREVVIFWGSQSGKAERLAKNLCRELQNRCGIKAMAADLDLYDHKYLVTVPVDRYVGFIVSTFGEGDPPDNGAGLYDTLLRIKKDTIDNMGQKPLCNLRYFAFGLGNSKYQHFNKFVDVIDEILLQAGAHCLGTIGKADEASRSDDAWPIWKEAFLEELMEHQGKGRLQPQAQTGGDLQVVDQLPTRKNQLVHRGEPFRQQGNKKANAMIAPVKQIKLLSSKRSENTESRIYLHIELSLGSEPHFSYKSGDHVAIWPMNPEEEVKRLSRLFAWDDKKLNAVVDIKQVDPDGEISISIPTPTTRAAILRNYLDICGPVSKEIIQLLSNFAPTSAAKQYLEEIARDRIDWARSNYMTLGKLMERSDSAVKEKWPEKLFGNLLDMLPRLQPRYFSIASSPTVDPQTLSMTVKVIQTSIEGTTQKFYGLTTNYLYALQGDLRHLDGANQAGYIKQNEAITPEFALAGPNSSLKGGKVYMHIRPSTFKLPMDVSRPLLLMAAGSGIAPFRAFIQERVKLALERNIKIGKMLLFFGCRLPNEDFLYGSEWKSLQQKLIAAGNEKLLEVDCAFSRLSEQSGAKTYVQDRVISRKFEVLDLLLQENAAWYICGSVHLATGVKSVVKDILQSVRGFQAEESDRFINDLKEHGSLQEDIWV
ncbi:hypothetical protein Plec18170_005255 [Paecilomyces lecythidis]